MPDLNNRLDYLKAQRPALGSGDQYEIAPGVHWAAMPVGGRLEAINVWVLRDRANWSIVDTGFRNAATIGAWRALMDGLFDGGKPDRIFCTHMHPDHTGLAGWFAADFGARLWMSRLEYFVLRMLTTDQGKAAPEEAVDFYRSTGFAATSIDRLRSRFGEFGHMIYPLPQAFHAVTHGDRIDIDNDEWQVIVGEGHSPEHSCFYNPSRNLIISGDQVLPTISSNVSVYPYEPDADPLTRWLSTLQRIKDMVPADVLVLPAHGQPFIGLHQRIDQLLDEHERGLAALGEKLSVRSRPVDLYGALFRREITPELEIMAVGETLAHLACLRSRGQASMEKDAAGIQWWARA